MTARGIRPADILLPRVESMERWSVVACDQFTENADYWRRVDDYVGGAPSTLRMILPEAEIGRGDVGERIGRIEETMEKYVREGIFEEHRDAMFYVERGQSGGLRRRGVVCMLDLMEYDYSPESGSLIRATEKTVEERIPPRVAIRSGALLELPHIVVFIDDDKKRVIDALSRGKSGMKKLYGFDLMENGGRIDGWEISEDQKQRLLEDVGELEESTPMLYAVGDGNHSLAAAKALFEKQRAGMSESEWKNLPSRYALAEIVSLHDEAIVFKSIHRALSGADPGAVLAALAPLCARGAGDINWFAGERRGSFSFSDASALPARALQDFLDGYVAANGGRIDYVHGHGALEKLCSGKDTIGFELPDSDKERLFSLVIEHGPLPRKTFSVGRAVDKRYYLESREIR